MSDHLKATIADLQGKLSEQEARVTKTKSLINELAEMAGMKPLYLIEDSVKNAGINLSIRSDQFYGQPQASCVREILELRKAQNRGPATVNEIFEALKEGGFAFDTKNDENAKRGLRISIAKNTALFHKLPNGQIGLLDWYPSARNRKKETAAANATAAAAHGEPIDDGFGEDDDDGLGRDEDEAL